MKATQKEVNTCIEISIANEQ